MTFAGITMSLETEDVRPVTLAVLDEVSKLYAICDDTVIAHFADMYDPSAVLAIIVALPSAMAVTRPLLLTDATAGLLLVHVTLLSVASSGVTVAVSCKV